MRDHQDATRDPLRVNGYHRHRVEAHLSHCMRSSELWQMTTLGEG
jgi:hypothetical protein